MKYFKHIPILLLCCGMFSSCNLNLVPENALTSANAFATERELNATTSSIHFFLHQAVEPIFIHQQVGEVCDYMSTHMDVRNWNPKVVPSSAPSWKNFYDVIFECNLLLENIHRTQDLTEERANYHKGQAYFAKGFSYLNIAQRYGDAIVTKDATTVTPYGISPMQDVIDEAIKAGDEAYKILPAFEDLKLLNGVAPTNKQYASKGAAAALLAHAYAWKGSMIELYGLEGDAKECYRKSIAYSTDIIDGKTGSYALLPSVKELCDALSDPTSINSEDIWVIAYDIAGSTFGVSPSPVRSYVSYPVNKLDKLGDLKAKTDMLIYESTIRGMYPDESDERLKEFFYKIDEKHDPDGNGREYALMYKYRKALFLVDQEAGAGESYRSISANYNYWRLADIYLLRAECYAKLGNEGAAQVDLNVIRNRAKAKAYPADQDKQGVQHAIFKERERELLYESDHRFFDVVRNDYYSTELQGKFKSLTKNDIKDGALFLPVPQSAYGDGGRNTLVRQKPYWSKYI